MKHAAWLILMLLVAVGCESGDDAVSACGSPNPLSGRLIDAPVEGMRYSSNRPMVADRPSCHFGTTNFNGEFFYEPDEHVWFRFCLACPGMPQVPAQAIVTPADFVDAAFNLQDKQRTFRNLLRFIQTLDIDGDPNNGIRLPTIPVDVYNEAFPPGVREMYIDVFDVDESEFETDPAILTIIGRVTNTSNLVDGDTAEAHFDQVIAGLPEYEDPRVNW